MVTTDAGAIPRSQQVEEDSPAGEIHGAQIAAALLRLGKLGGPAEEMLIIEAADESSRSPGAPCSAAASYGACPPLPIQARQQPSHTAEAEDPIVEGDLLVLDCDAEEEMGPAWSLPLHPAPGSTRGRRLMQARSKQCVVCMEEKEHTFVPLHREDAGQHVDGHRFCTDCWREFLQHGLQRAPITMPPPLTCPLCRGAVDVPDVWGVEYELPCTWTQASAASREASPASPSAAGLLGWLSAESSSFWADAAPGAGTGTGQLPALPEEECSPVVHARAEPRRPGADGLRWLALSCPVPNWQAGSYLRRLYDAFACGTLVQRVGLDGEFSATGL